MPDCFADSSPFVLVLVPSAETIDPSLDYYGDYTHSRDELARVFDSANVEWRWAPVTLHTYRTVIDAARGEDHPRLVVFNLCDGDEINHVPGISVIRYLDDVGVPYTGASAEFYRATTSKIDMKHAFDRAGVRTPPWAVIRKKADTAGLFERLGAPLMVKPAVSAGSMGITTHSVVSHHDALCEQLNELDKGYKGWDLASGGVFVERFIEGREFTALVVGAGDVHPPVERVFHPSLPSRERFLSYDRLWEVYERESRVGGEGEYLWEYSAAPAELHAPIAALSRAAYDAVGGCGYGRVDLRMSDAGELFVLEVNAQCGLSEDENQTSIGAILRFGERPFSTLVREIVDLALSRHL